LAVEQAGKDTKAGAIIWRVVTRETDLL
jgi:hypothetical protein